MKKRLFLLWALYILAIPFAHAQKSEAQFRMYMKGANTSNYYYLPANTVDSVKFVTENFDVYVYAYPGISENGKLCLDVSVGYSFSVKDVRAGVVPASMSNDEIMNAYANGSFDLMPATMNKQFEVEDGTYKAVAFGLDADGTMRSFNSSDEIHISEALKENVVSPLKQIVTNNQHNAWGYGSLMLIRDLMGEDVTFTGATNYSHYNAWMQNQYMGEDYARQQNIYLYFDRTIESLSKTIQKLKPAYNDSYLKTLLGTAIALRALHYLDAARMYEFLENDAVSPINQHGNHVAGLTYPIGYEAEYRADSTLVAKRATREEMAEYIDSELNKAELCLKGVFTQNKELASEAVIYGLKARLYLWIENYPKALEYAEKAIALGQHSVLTENEWTDKISGFNNSNTPAWMWAIKYKENVSDIMSWTSWWSNQTTFGYTGASTGLYSVACKAFYDRIADTDFRKKSFKAPSESALSGTEIYPNDVDFAALPTYASLKFRPGNGNVVDYLVGNVIDIPLMRIEEMYFIKFEAMAQNANYSGAMQEMTQFLRTHRNAEYSCTVETTEECIDEILFQKRLELWGEGQIFFDYKRLNKPVTRSYEGTNYLPNGRFNTTSRPAWMNFVFVRNAFNNQIKPWNNPDPSDCYPLQ